jgi:Uma2 family endonuclease
MVTTRLLSAEDFALIETDEPWELWGGEVRRVPGAGLEASEMSGVIFSLVFGFVRPRNLGVVTVTDGAYILARNPDVVVMPDVAFIAWDRLPGRIRPKGFSPVPPNLAVEVASPSDRTGDIAAKMARYRAAGVTLVWWVYPGDRTVAVYRDGEFVATLGENDTLDGEDVLPGFSLPVSEIFS